MTPSKSGLVAAFALRKQYNDHVMAVYAVVLAGLMGLFIIFHQSRAVGHRGNVGRGFAATLEAPFLFFSRFVNFPSLPENEESLTLLQARAKGFDEAGPGFPVDGPPRARFCLRGPQCRPDAV